MVGGSNRGILDRAEDRIVLRFLLIMVPVDGLLALARQ